MNKCDICYTQDVLDLEFGIDISPFHLCEECYERFFDSIQQGISGVFAYIAGLNPNKTSRDIECSDEFQCDICKNVEDYSKYHVLWLTDEHYHTCDYCADTLNFVIEFVLHTLRSARNGELTNE